MNNGRPKIGLALSGAAARSAFYIGFLEVMREHGTPIDYIGAQSGATIVAASFACGTLEDLKQYIFSMDGKSALRLIKSNGGKGGWYSLDKFEELVRDRFTHHASFEEVNPKLIFVATDINAGEPVLLAMGDIARACRFSCTVPGLIQPANWGNRMLVDGGVTSFIPSEQVREAGSDIVIGVNVRATKHIFLPHQLRLRHAYNVIKRRLTPRRGLLGVLRSFDILEQSDAMDYFEPLSYVDAEPEAPGMFSVLGRSLDLAVAASRKTKEQEPNYGCDLLIREGTGDLGGSVRVSDMRDLYAAGRRTAEERLPDIKQLLRGRGVIL